MKLRKARSQEIPPQGVRIRRGDGTLIGCDVLRDPDQDRDGCAMWVAVPRERFVGYPGEMVALEMDMLPGKTLVSLDMHPRRPEG